MDLIRVERTRSKREVRPAGVVSCRKRKDKNQRVCGEEGFSKLDSSWCASSKSSSISKVEEAEDGDDDDDGVEG